MSTNIPTRRTTRTTRATALKENENANSRPQRPQMRIKQSGIASNSLAPSILGVTRATAASRAKATDAILDVHAGKRKRDALGEVAGPGNGNKPSALQGKGKQKETFDGVVIKGKNVPVRQPLRTVSTTRQIASNLPVDAATASTFVKSEIKEEQETFVVNDENAMIIDAPTEVQPPRIAVRRSTVVKESLSMASRRSEIHRRVSLRAAGNLHIHVKDNLEPEEPAYKKRRTSSIPPEEAATAPEEEEVRKAMLAAEMEAIANEPEADPENSPWDDLDLEDADDTLMVSEYVQDIFHYMKQVELTTMPNPNYMENQKELAWQMRGVLSDWLIQVHVRFRLLPETLFLCVNIIDRFLSAKLVSLAKLQLVGITSLFIAAKFEEIVAPSVTNLLLCADSSCTEPGILQAERYMLKTLDWNLSYPNPVHYLRRVSKADNYNVKVRTLGKYLLEIGILEWRLIAAPPSLLAAASIWLARIALGLEQWTPNLAHYSSYKESSLIPTANLMLNYILKPIRHDSFFKKYAGKRYYKSSLYMREWALQQWEESTQVDLTKELVRIKAEIRIHRQREEATAEGEGEGEMGNVGLDGNLSNLAELRVR